MFPITLHREGNAGYQSQGLGTFMIEMPRFQILRQFFVGFEILPILAMVVHILQHFYGFLKPLLTPALGSSDIAQVSESIAIVLTVLVVEVFLQGGYLLLAEVMVLHEVIAAQGLGIDGDAFLCHTFHLCLLLWRQEKSAGIDNHSIIPGETAHLLSLHTVHLNLRMVIAQHDVGLLGFQSIHHDDACGSYEMAIDGYTDYRQ